MTFVTPLLPSKAMSVEQIKESTSQKVTTANRELLRSCLDVGDSNDEAFRRKCFAAASDTFSNYVAREQETQGIEQAELLRKNLVAVMHEFEPSFPVAGALNDEQRQSLPAVFVPLDNRDPTESYALNLSRVTALVSSRIHIPIPLFIAFLAGIMALFSVQAFLY